ncbi:hypothetical protein GCM10009632_24910 [Mycolicibacterium alvei]|uniref:Uncharacterized protein n=2 Tax=Mycolicibacterium alvei TaxID=67081 RepID=A0A6N4V0Z5_9MYCO|nr:hypothetical protein MALV_49180 [Mycolicibacterium alvei]
MPFSLPQKVNIPGDLASLAPVAAQAALPAAAAPLAPAAAAAPAIAAPAAAAPAAFNPEIAALAPLLTAGLP